MQALFGNFNLDITSRFTYSNGKEVGDSSFVFQKPANLHALTVFKATASRADAIINCYKSFFFSPWEQNSR